MSWQGLKGWFHENGRRFFVSAAVTATCCIAAALLFGLDEVLRAGFTGLVAALTWPFAIVIGVALALALLLLPFILLAAAADSDISDGGLISDVADAVVKPYYGWLARRRNPIFWGIPFGVGVALAILAIVAYVRDAPARAEQRDRERLAADTQEILETTRGAIEGAYAQDGAFPEEIAAMRDSYGRPLTYRVVESRTRSSFTLTSQGADPSTADDDICVDGYYARRDGATLLGKLARRVVLGREPDPVRCPRR